MASLLDRGGVAVTGSRMRVALRTAVLVLLLAAVLYLLNDYLCVRGLNALVVC
jgi:hypothetical protein